ncbi:MAG: site-specific integrase [Chitinophagales bacterium]|nr:site-specific integrase [Chitinophagales bacterium]
MLPAHAQFLPDTHREQRVLFIKFPPTPENNRLVREMSSTRWSHSRRMWYLPDTPEHRNLLHVNEAVATGKQLLGNIYEVNRAPVKQMIEKLQLLGRSPNTIKTYTYEFAQLLYALKKHPVEELGPERLRAYFLYCANELKLTESQIHSRMNAVKFYFEQVLKREKLFVDIPRPKKHSMLPKVIDKKDVAKMFAAMPNLKHRLMLKLCYGMGLRVSEVVALKITDIDSKRMLVQIERAKGKRDRYVNLPQSVLEELRAYFKQYKPRYYLFEGQGGGLYSIRSVQAVFKQAMQRANIRKPVGIHGLRHSYATHLLEQGTDVRLIKELLGHKDVRTTLIYAHVSKRSLANVKSPLDEL